jgi:2-amino-4-hydroxy-6-hydroxymethyldihydropteridine diphosphokinase
MVWKTAYLGLGSNLGDRADNLRVAIGLLGLSGKCVVELVSSVYETLPVGELDQPDFLNAVVRVRTELAPRGLLELCLDIEQTLGRVRTKRWGPRVIDMDILLYEDIEISEDDLTIPHASMLDRAFVLAPLADIAPDMILESGITAADAAKAIDQVGIKRTDIALWSK